MSFGNGPKIYLRGAKPSILKYGSLGHRPLLLERLALTHVCHLLVFSLLEFFCLSSNFYGSCWLFTV